MERSTLVQHIRRQERQTPGATGEFTSLMYEILVAAKLISSEVNKAGLGEDILGMTGDTNIQGEEVQKLDQYANNIFIKVLRETGSVCAIGSEENEKPLIFPSGLGSGKYIFMMDPLDGSSNIDVNINIGTIFSLYRKVSLGDTVTEEDLLQKADQQIAAGYILYGSSTVFIYTTGKGVHGFTLDPSIGEFFLSHPNIKIPKSGSTYSVNEGNSGFWSDKQANLVNYLKTNGREGKKPYKSRYIGTLVADFHRTLLKGGIFMYPEDKRFPNGKLRFCFEGAPLAFIVENAGGRASTGKETILEMKPNEIHQRTPLFIGSKNDIELAEKMLAAP